jgi:hypothetical protein
MTAATDTGTGWTSHLLLLFAWYLRVKDILLRGGIFLSIGKWIGLDEMLTSLAFGPGYHVITFANLLMFFDLNDLVYQSDYPLTIGNKSKGVINIPSMRDAINALIQRGHVVWGCARGRWASPSTAWTLLRARKTWNPVLSVEPLHGSAQCCDWIWGSFQEGGFIGYQDHMMVWKGHKNRLMKNHKWSGKVIFMYWLYYGLIWLIEEILLISNLVYINGGELSCFVGVKIIAGIMWFIADGLLMEPDTQDNIMGRGQVTAMMNILNVDLPTAVWKAKRVMDFFYEFGKWGEFASHNELELFAACMGCCKPNVTGSVDACCRPVSESWWQELSYLSRSNFVAEIRDSCLRASNAHELLERIQIPDWCKK